MLQDAVAPQLVASHLAEAVQTLLPGAVGGQHCADRLSKRKRRSMTFWGATRFEDRERRMYPGMSPSGDNPSSGWYRTCSNGQHSSKDSV